MSKLQPLSRTSLHLIRHPWRYQPLIELLEARIVFASDFGDAPLPYKTLLAEGGAEHVAVGPTLGANRDTEADGVHSVNADGDDTTGIDDEDGVTFGTIRAGALGATATVNVQGGSAKLDAWIDFNGDGSWGGPGEQIADAEAVATGSNTISFDVSSTARDGTTYARFRLSSAGDLGVGGAAADGEVEDYAVTVTPPKAACGCFEGPKDVNFAASGAYSVHAADVDGDGDTDVLSASKDDDKIAWYENDGHQDFTGHIISTAANGAVSVYAVDVDGDGDSDVLSASFYDDKIAWYENDGSQNFIAHVISTAANGAVSVYAVDVDGDGDSDVLSASFYDDKIAWYENDGSQNFIAHVISTAANGAIGVYAVDVDGDGDTDVLSASFYDDKIAWYENDGNQNFSAHLISTIDGPDSVYAADVDGDGDIDALSGAVLDNSVAWYENDGNQNFTAHLISTDADGAQGVFATDVDSDGDIDVLSASARDDKIAWYENDGSQNFAAHTITTFADLARSVYAADVDGDGDTDVLSASEFDDKIAWYENDGSQNFAAHSISSSANGARSVHAADMDSDGDIDVLSASARDDKIAWYENDGNQNFTIHIITTVANGANSVHAADVDGDGDIDVLSTSHYAHVVAWYENDGNQTFTLHTIAVVTGARSVLAVDLEGDGDVDALSSTNFGAAWYENDGSQNFTLHFIPTGNPSDATVSVYAADVDSDGDLDVLSASAQDDKIAWYENDGSQNFTAHSITSTANGARSVYAADVDGDGDTDVLSASQYDNKIAWYENDGSQNFTIHVITTSADQAWSVFAVDVDGDGDVDVLSVARDDDKIEWYENDGSQNFVAHTITTAAIRAESVFAADVDGDGDTDVLSASSGDDTIAWYENFSFHVTDTNDSGPGSLRQAMLEANAHPGLDTLTFGIGAGYQTIAPTSALPTITDSVIIDGTTQPGYAGAPLIEVWGLAAGPNVHGLTLAADNSTVKGLVVNLFSFNGILITGSGNTIENTYVGTDVSGTISVPNALNGIEIAGGSNNTIGSTVAGAGNIIAFNGGRGVLIDTGTGNAVRQNSIHSNDDLGIALINGGNNDQRAPSVNSAVAGGGTTTIAVSLALSAPSTIFTIDFFSSAVCDPSTFGEGGTYLGSKTLTTMVTGRGRTIFVAGVAVPVGHVITATATHPNGDTSEFSKCRTVSTSTAPDGGGGANGTPAAVPVIQVANVVRALSPTFVAHRPHGGFVLHLVIADEAPNPNPPTTGPRLVAPPHRVSGGDWDDQYDLPLDVGLEFR